MKIDIYSRENCPFNPEILWTRGLGGAESAIVFIAEELGELGHDVTVWNDIPDDRSFGPVRYRSLSHGISYNSIETDLFIIFRVSLPTRPAKAKRAVFFSCDQSTDVRWNTMIPWVERFICISDFHMMYIMGNYPVKPSNLRVCELGINLPDYEPDVAGEKVKNAMIYCSVPHRGLDELLELWPTIMGRVPDATLYVTSDYTLWGRSTDPANHAFRAKAARLGNVSFLGNIRREDLVKIQRKCEIMPYPCTYEENFCISAMECVAAGCVPVTTPIGALPTTVGDSGVIIDEEDEPSVWLNDKDGKWKGKFVEAVVSLAENPAKRGKLMTAGRKRALGKYNYRKVAKRLLEVSFDE